MKEGAWIVAAEQRHVFITEHASWIQNTDQARALGLPEDAIARIQAIPWDVNGPGRVAICLEGMRHGLIRFRGHGATATLESVLPLAEVLRGASPFLDEVMGPFTMVKINRLDTGESWQSLYRDLQAIGITEVSR